MDLDYLFYCSSCIWWLYFQWIEPLQIVHTKYFNNKVLFVLIVSYFVIKKNTAITLQQVVISIQYCHHTTIKINLIIISCHRTQIFQYNLSRRYLYFETLEVIICSFIYYCSFFLTRNIIQPSIYHMQVLFSLQEHSTKWIIYYLNFKIS